MGIFGALTTAVSGLRAQSFALEHISDNIANSQTTAYKRTETSFIDIVSESQPGNQGGGVVAGRSRATNDISGDILSSSVATHVAINGNGFFMVEQPAGYVDGKPTFRGVDNFTRRGDFALDKDGHLVNGAGYMLKGLPIDPATGNPTGTLPQVIQVTNDLLPAQQTTRIDYRANLGMVPQTANYDPDIAGSELIDPADFTADPTTATNPPAPVPASEASVFLDNSVAGGAITTYNSSGAAVNVQFRWAKIDSAASGGSDIWNLFYLTDTAATGTDPMWVNVGQAYEFSADGALVQPASGTTTISGLTVNGTTVGDVLLDHGASGLSQFADSQGVVRVTDIDQNGYSTGELIDVAVSETGRVVGIYSNGEALDIAEIAVANFKAPGMLRKLDGGAFAATAESGNPTLGLQGRIFAQSLEGSNADIAEEFAKLIVTQQAYTASTRIVTTGDEMLQEAVNMVR